MTSTPGDSKPPLPAVLPEAAELTEYTDAMKYQYEMGELLAANPGLPPRFKAQQTYTYCVDGEVLSCQAEPHQSSPPAQHESTKEHAMLEGTEGDIPDYWCQFEPRPVLIEAVQWETPEQGHSIAQWCAGSYRPNTAGEANPGAEQWGELLVPTRGGVLTVTPYDYVIRTGRNQYHLSTPELFEHIHHEIHRPDREDHLAHSTAWRRRRSIAPAISPVGPRP